jgi:hypothetical protein
LGRTCRRMYRVTQHTLYREIIASNTADGRTLRVNLADLVSISCLDFRSMGRPE